MCGYIIMFRFEHIVCVWFGNVFVSHHGGAVFARGVNVLWLLLTILYTKGTKENLRTE